MRFDQGPRVAVALIGSVIAILGAAGCGPTVRPDRPGGDPDDASVVITPPPKPAGARTGRQMILGEMCPRAAAGRPGVAPLVVRGGVSWTDDPDAVADPIARGTAGKFAVLGYNGARAGVFESLGAADAGLPQDVAAGTFVGASPCTRDAGRGQRAEEPSCGAAVKGCGLAVATVADGDDPPPTIEPGGACMGGDLLAVDVDADGKAEAFPIAAFLDSVRAPADEVSASRVAAPACTPAFSVYGLKLAPGVEPGAKVDPKYQVIVDVLGVLDLDADGRSEVVLALRYPDSRTIVVYSATSGARLERAGESVAWR